MGKSNTSTQKTTVPADVLARYNTVNQQAQNVAQTPFQVYSTDPNAFVAPLTSTQQAGIAGTNAAAGEAQPYFGQATTALEGAQTATQPYYGAAGSYLNQAGNTIGGIGQTLNASQPYNTAATGLALAGAQAVNPTDLNASAIDKYISPYLSTVLGSTSALLNQNNQQQMSGELGNIIQSGAFGGDRAGLAAANLEQQQNLANANIYSGILNNAYTQALGAAQGQQALGLSAAQANRAALQGASGQIQGIGQQIYGQGTGAEQLQYGQQTGLAGAQEGLGQTVYNTGAATSQALAGLGAGAQAAALQGAQAQLAAGQQQQQTEQAGKSALYNQFLQQQSYPFQVAQFLANIAEGTGSLSGQTTTTTQPGSLFSDRRLKTGLKVVGKTFDGTPIYTYRYKGDDTTRMGLMAQDVEKAHPEAVGLAGGYRTVDYDKATEKAAERGHFRRGGLVPYKGYAYGGSPGFDPALAQALLQNEQGMFGPYTTGLGGAPGGAGGPYGSSARVPAANLPVAGLKIPAMQTAQQPGALHQANQTAKDWADMASNVEKGTDWMKAKMAPANDSAQSLAQDSASGRYDDLSDLGRKRGGRARGRFAGGGLPYQGGLALDIPDQPDQYHLPSPPSSTSAQQGSSAMGDIKDAADIAASVAKIAAMFRRGGLAEARHGYDVGGMPNFDESGASFFGGDGGGQSTGLSPNFDETGLAQDKGPALVDPKAAKTPEEYKAAILHNAAQTAQTPQDYGAILRAASPGPSAPSRRQGARASGLAGASADPWPNGPPLDVGNQTITPEPQMGQGPSIAASAPADIQPLPSLSGLGQSTPDNGPDLAQSAKDRISDVLGKVAPQGGYLDRLFHGDKMTLIPFLTGLGAMTAAPTRDPFTALTQGLEAGAKTYQQLQMQQPQIEAEQARVGEIGAQAGLFGNEAYEQLQKSAPAGYQLVPGTGPDGKSFMVNGKPYHYALQAALTDFGVGKTPYAAPTVVSAHAVPTQAPSVDTDVTMRQTYGVDPSQPGAANRMRMIGLNPATAALDQEAEKAAQARIGNLAEADSTHRNLLQSAEALSELSKGTLTGQGYNSAYRSQLANIYSTLTGMMGIPPDPKVTADLTAHQITDKIRQLSGAQIAHQYGERAASIAHSIADVLPSGDLTPQAASHILAQMLVANQQQRDFAQYHNAYVGRYGTSVNVEPAFQKDSGNIYDTEQRRLASLLSSEALRPYMNALGSSDQRKRQAAIADLDRKGGEGFHRYLTGGW